MGRESLVSVVMPFHNTPSAFIEEAIESVLRQSYPNWELLLVDDGSTENCSAVAFEYSRMNSDRVILLSHEGHANRGASASRNLGLRRASGEYISFLDADDVWLPNKLQEQVEILASYPEAGMLYGNTQYWYSWTGRPEDSDRDFIPPLGVLTNTLIPAPSLVSSYLRGDAAVPCTCSVMVRKEVLDTVGGFEDEFTFVYTDQVFYSKVCLHSSTVVSGQCWDRYRQHPDSSCVIARESGHMKQARREFLVWLEDYVRRMGIDDADLYAAIRTELAGSGTSEWYDFRRALWYFRRRIRKMRRRIAGQ